MWMDAFFLRCSQLFIKRIVLNSYLSHDHVAEFFKNGVCGIRNYCFNLKTQLCGLQLTNPSFNFKENNSLIRSETKKIIKIKI